MILLSTENLQNELIHAKIELDKKSEKWNEVQNSVSDTIDSSLVFSILRNKVTPVFEISEHLKTYLQCAINIIEQFPVGIIFYSTTEGYFYRNNIFKYMKKKVKTKLSRDRFVSDHHLSYVDFLKDKSRVDELDHRSKTEEKFFDKLLNKYNSKVTLNEDIKMLTERIFSFND